jgi:hypothetical protein
MKTKRSLRLTIAAFGLATFNASAATLYVSLESANPVAPYSTWATAATNIQDAVDAARAGDTVLVTNGVYAVGGSDWDWIGVTITNAIRLESLNGPLLTTIDGGLLCDENGFPTNGVPCISLATNAVLNGFTLTNGRVGVLGKGLGAVVTNCVITGNSGMIGGSGGGNFCTLYNCTITGNTGDDGGGACLCTLYNCTVTGNFASGGGGVSESTLYNCVLTGNSARFDGGGAAWDCVLWNCTVTGNSAGDYGGGAIGATLYNCIVYYNIAQHGPNHFTGIEMDPISWGGELSTEMHNCCTTPLPTNGVGNITSPPLFMDMAAADFRLREGSPCIDAGANLVGFSTTVRDMWDQPLVIAYTHDSIDILGNTRFIDGNGDGIVAWDIGAYEFDSFKPPRFSAPPQLTPDGWKLKVTGPTNKLVWVQRSSNLKDWEDVTHLEVFLGGEGVAQITDYDTSQKMRFYRVVVQ